MNGLVRFNLIFLPCLILAAVAVAYFLRGTLRTHAEAEALQNARMIMESGIAARTYTTKQIAPLIEQDREKLDQAAADLRRVLDERLPAVLQGAAESFPNVRERPNVVAAHRKVLETVRQEAPRPQAPEFYPQSVPAYASTEVFNYFREHYPNFSYREAVLNPTNPRDRTVDWEADVVNSFRNGSSERKEIIGRRNTAVGDSLFLAAPIRITNRSCLVCHSTPDAAPAQMIRQYGRDNGFGWKFEEIVGAQIVSVPVAHADTSAQAAFKELGLPLGGLFCGLLLLGNVGAAAAVRGGSVRNGGGGLPPSVPASQA